MVLPVTPRRAFLQALGGTALCSLSGCERLDSDPTISVPGTALTDEQVAITVDGINGRDTVTVRTRASTRDGIEWTARATFETREDGTVDAAEQAPVDGSYEGVDPMGLFWSKRPATVGTDQQLPPATIFAPPDEEYDITITVEGADGELAEATTTRRLYDPGIEQRAVAHDDIVGELFLPPGTDPAPGVVHLHGVGGQPHLPTGRLLASRGIATLTLQYFGEPDPLPDTLREVPVEYVERAIAWCKRQDRVAGPAIGLVGFSRGGPLALLAGTHRDDVGAVAVWVGSGIVYEGLESGRRPAGTSAWSVDGEPVPYLELADANPGPPPNEGLPYFEPPLSAASDADLAAATIPAERVDAPIYLSSVTDDRRWPSTRLSEWVVDRLDAADYPHEYRHDAHEDAGHFILLPYLPTAGTMRDQRNVYGGTPGANARANATTWSRTVSFLADALDGAEA